MQTLVVLPAQDLSQERVKRSKRTISWAPYEAELQRNTRQLLALRNSAY